MALKSQGRFMNNRFLFALTIVAVFCSSFVAIAQTHKGMSFQGVIKMPNNEYPTASGITVKAKILSSNNCILRAEEFQGVNISNGYINLVIGTGAPTSDDPGLTLSKAMDNSTTISGGPTKPGGLVCLDENGNISSSTSYDPTNTSGIRKFRIELNVGSMPLKADFNMRSVAYALNSESLNGKTESNFVQTSTNITQNKAEDWFASAVMGQLLAGSYNAASADNATTAVTALNVSGTVAIANGGTGATTASAARTNLGLGPLATMNPTGTADSSTFLRGDGTWVAASGGVSSVAGKTGVVTLAATDVTDFNTAADARITAQKAQSNGLATLDGTGKVPSTQLALSASDIPSLDAAKITSGTLTQNVSASSVASATGSFTSLKIYDGTSQYITMTLPSGGTGYTLNWPNAVGGAGQVLQTDATGNLSWVAIPSAPVTSVAGKTGVVTLSSTDISGLGTAATLNVAASGNAAANEIVKGNDSRLTGAFISSTALSGDLSGTLPSPVVEKIKGQSVSAVGSSVGQVLRYAGTNTWTPAFISMFDLRSTITGAQAFGGVGCLANQTLTWTAATDNLACTSIAISNTQVSGLVASATTDTTNATNITSGTLSVARGGTNSSTALNNNRVMVSSGGSIVESGALTNGQLLIGSTGAAPVVANLTGTANQISVANGAGSITLSTPQNIHTAATPTFAGMTLTPSASGGLTLNPYGVSAGNTSEIRFNELAAGGTNYVGFKSPDALSANKIWTLPAADGTANQILQTNGAGVLSWTSPTFNSVLSGINAATAVNTIDNLNYGQTWNWSTATTHIPMSFTADSLTSGSLLKLTTMSASLNSTSGLLYIANTGSSTSGITARIQSNSTAGSGLTVLGNGSIGVGTTTTAAKLDVNGTIKSKAVSNTGTTIDFDTGNLQYTSSSCGSMALHNLKSGATYTLAVQGTAGGVCSFTAYSDAGSTSLTLKNGGSSMSQAVNKHTLFTFLVMGNFVYVASIDGY